MSYIPREKSKTIAKSTSKAIVKAHPSLNSLSTKSNVPSLEMLEQTSRFQLHRSLLKRWKIRKIQKTSAEDSIKRKETQKLAECQSHHQATIYSSIYTTVSTPLPDHVPDWWHFVLVIKTNQAALWLFWRLWTIVHKISI